MVDFIADPFNVERGGSGSYMSFIKKLNRLVAVRGSHDRPVTPIEVNPPTQFFDIVLQTNSHSIRMRLRRDSLYLVGYQMQNSNQWLELRYDNDRNNPRHRITGSTFLDIHDSYRLLTKVADVALSGIYTGRHELISAINSLATSTNNMKMAHSLIVVIVMVIEAMRFAPIAIHFGTLGTTSLRIPAWIEIYVRGWGGLSAALLYEDVHAHFRFPTVNNFGIRGSDDAAAILGIVKGHYFKPGVFPSLHPPVGRPLVEFFSVTINNINGNQNIIGDIYGAIQVSDGLGYEYLYNRGENGSESVHAGETVLLNGPTRCITAYDNFSVDVILMSREGDEISKGQILWEVTNITINEYDKFLFQEIEGRFGLATMSYAVLSNAVVATVEIRYVKNEDPENPVDVYGLVTSHNDNLNSESVLFRKARNKFVNVMPGKVIPLSRTIVAVPLNSSLVLRADLKEFSIFSSDDKIASGIATFVPRNFGTQAHHIYGNNDNHIRVQVTWSWYV